MKVPKILQSDNGGEFKNSILDQYLSKINVRHYLEAHITRNHKVV